jgi:hypothetical protein
VSVVSPARAGSATAGFSADRFAAGTGALRAAAFFGAGVDSGAAAFSGAAGFPVFSVAADFFAAADFLAGAAGSGAGCAADLRDVGMVILRAETYHCAAVAAGQARPGRR